MADDLPSLSTVAISRADEALREFKHLPDKRRRERPKGTPIALDGLAEEEPIEDQAAEDEHQLDVSA